MRQLYERAPARRARIEREVRELFDSIRNPPQPSQEPPVKVLPGDICPTCTSIVPGTDEQKAAVAQRKEDDKRAENKAQLQSLYDDYRNKVEMRDSFVHGLRWCGFFGALFGSLLALAVVTNLISALFEPIYLTAYIVGPIGLGVVLICTVTWIIGHQEGQDSPGHAVRKAKRLYDRRSIETGEVAIIVD